MSIASASRLRNEMCFCILCIDGHEKGDISGRIFNAYYRDAIGFDNTMEMIAKLEDIFDIFGYPHQTMDLRRSFAAEREEKQGDAAETKASGKGKKGKASQKKEYEGVTRIGLAAAEDYGLRGSTLKSSAVTGINSGRGIPGSAATGINSGNGEGRVVGRRLHVAPTTHLIKHNARGKLATLKTRIMFRQNAEWQGNARWLEEDLVEDFSSVLELMMLIDSIFGEY